MSNTAWQAFYYHGCDNSHPPARTELIEAASEDEAAKIARVTWAAASASTSTLPAGTPNRI